MSSWLDAVTNPLTAATKTLQELVEVRDLVKFGDTFRKMHDEILAASGNALAGYRRELELLEQIRALKAHVAELEERKTQEQKYELKNLGWGAFAYMLKKDARGSEPPHWICTNCYSNHRISQIQHVSVLGHGYRYRCPACKSDIDPAPDSVDGNNPKWLD